MDVKTRGGRRVWTLDDVEATRLIEQEKLTVIQVAARLGVSRQAIYHAIEMGRIPRPEPKPRAA
jgi:predicted DNA-binding protein (UPF0251 family)